MKRWQRILSIFGGVSLAVLMLVGTTTALLTDEEQAEPVFVVNGETVDINLTVEGLAEGVNTVHPGQSFSIKPVIENKGTASVYIFQEMDVPMIGEIPLFLYTADTGYWELVKVTNEDGYQKAIYSYGSMTALEMDETTEDHPLIEKATFGNIRGGESEQEYTVTIKAYAVTDAGFDGDPADLEPEAVWNTAFGY